MVTIPEILDGGGQCRSVERRVERSVWIKTTKARAYIWTDKISTDQNFAAWQNYNFYKRFVSKSSGGKVSRGKRIIKTAVGVLICEVIH